MKALVYHGPGQKAWEDVPDPRIQKPTDIIVKIETTTICGTDLHILKGDVPAVEYGRILGHEGVGTITEIGSAVAGLTIGDRVIISCISACGHLDYCRQGVYSHCLGEEGAPGIGWILGHLIDGTQAEFVRVPYEETSVYKIPDSVSPQAGTLLSDILPTGSEIGVQYGAVKPGDVIAVIGAGTVGLAVANAGVHGKGVDLPLDRLWISNITITTGLLNTNTTGTLLKLVAQKKLPVDQFVSHAFDLNDIEKAYDTFSRAAETKALKVMLNA